MRFQVLDVLGRGGMGVVLLARDPELERNVAIKLVSSPSAFLSSRLLREAKAMAQLRHPNVVAVFEAGIDEHGRVYMVMEAGQQTLRQLLSRHALPWRDVVDLFIAAGQGLSAAHDAGFVHRDFKPDNVLLGEDGRVRVGDFGLVSGDSGVASPSQPLLGGAQLLSDVLGTPAYMPPEQCPGGRVDARGDQFSFCVSLWEALYGELPFSGQTEDEYTRATEEGRLREPPAGSPVPRWVGQVLARGLSPDPDRRFPSMQALLAEFSRDKFTPYAPGMQFFGMLVVIFIACPLTTLFSEMSWPLLFASEIVVLLAIGSFRFFMRDLIERSSFNSIGYHLIIVGICSLLMLSFGGWICGLSAYEATVLNPFFQGVIALVAIATLETSMALVAGLYMVAFVGAGIYPPAGPVLLSIANASMLIVAFVLWRPRNRASSIAGRGEGAVALAGERIGRFTVMRVLREVDGDSLMEAHDPRLNRRVMLQLGSVGLREARGIAALCHPNLITVYQVGIHEALSYVAYEWVKGRTLREELAENPDLGWERILALFVAAGRGLAAGHDAGFVHGTFSAERVHLEDGGRVLVGGFGLRTSSGATRELHRAAPEVIAGRAPTAASDQFSFCATLWSALYGSRLLAGTTTVAGQTFADGTDAGYATATSRAPVWIKEILERGLRARPEERYESVEALLRELEHTGRSGPSRLQMRSLLAYAPLALVPLCASGLNLGAHQPFSHLETLALAGSCLLYVLLLELAMKAPRSVLRNRWSWWGLTICLVSSSLLPIGAVLSGISATVAEPLHLLGYATVAGGIVVGAESRIWPSVVFFGGGFLLACFFPDRLYLITAGAGLLCAANAAWVCPRPAP